MTAIYDFFSEFMKETELELHTMEHEMNDKMAREKEEAEQKEMAKKWRCERPQFG